MERNFNTKKLIFLSGSYYMKAVRNLSIFYKSFTRGSFHAEITAERFPNKITIFA